MNISKSTYAWILAGTVFAISLPAAAQRGPGRQEPQGWQVGAAFRRERALVAGVSWPQNPLRKTLIEYAKLRRVAIFLDRRVDPGQVIRFEGQRGTLDELMGRLASQLELGVGFVGPVIYIGPKDTSPKLATLLKIRSDQIRKLPAAAKRPLNRLGKLEWPRFTTPQKLLQRLISESKLTVRDQQLVPHDLWPACDLPSMAWSERLALILAGFNLTFAIEDGGSAIRIVNIPRHVGIERKYRMSRRVTLADLEKRFPGQYRVQGSQLLVSTTIENHGHINRLLSNRRPPRQKVNRNGKRPGYRKLRIQNKSISQILRALAQDQRLQLETDPRIRAKLGKLIKNFAVQDATLEEVLDKLLMPVMLRYQIKQGKLIVK